MRTAGVRISALFALAALAPGAQAAATLYSSQFTFLEAVGLYLTDTYQDPAYGQPDNFRGTFTDARMSDVFGETRYQSTGYGARNIVENQSGRAAYCAGCNGSFRLDFTATSIGNGNGVYAVGFDIVANQPVQPYVAYVTYGDNTHEDFALPVRVAQTPQASNVFWGITSTKRVRSIHFGGAGGAVLTAGGFAIDNLTIAAPIPKDTDGDGVQDFDDNCVNVPNGPAIPDPSGHSQVDADGDGYGNVCDADFDGSGLTTAADYNLFRSCVNRSSGYSELCAAADMNGSGRVTSSDLLLFRVRLNTAPGPSGLVAQ